MPGRGYKSWFVIVLFVCVFFLYIWECVFVVYWFVAPSLYIFVMLVNRICGMCYPCWLWIVFEGMKLLFVILVLWKGVKCFVCWQETPEIEFMLDSCEWPSFWMLSGQLGGGYVWLIWLFMCVFSLFFFLGDGVCNVIGFGRKCVWWL